MDHAQPAPDKSATGVERLPHGVQLTRVGLWFVIFGMIVVVAATNTGNNSLYMVAAVMISAAAVSVFSGWRNLRALDIRVEQHTEIFAGQPTSLAFTVTNKSRLVPRWLVQLWLVPTSRPALVTHVLRRRDPPTIFRGEQVVTFDERGRRALESAHLSTLFPFGFFRISRRDRLFASVLVYPRIFESSSSQYEVPGASGAETSTRAGWGHELFGLREMRPGDDPRDIHWKQTARTGRFVLKERSHEENRRLSILLDNAVGRDLDDTRRLAFEQLVSQAATAALDYLKRGYRVELITRDDHLRAAGGTRQRRAILECLALLETHARELEPLDIPSGVVGGDELRLSLRADAA